MRKPPPLRAGDTLGVIAPSSPFDEDQFQRGIAVLHSMGFQTMEGEHLRARNSHLAGTDRQRLADVEAMAANDDVAGIIAARGGFGALRFGSLLDCDLFRRSPKTFIGYSDLTVLLSALNRRASLIAFHGPMVTSLPRITDAARASFLAMITAEQFPPLEWDLTVEIRGGTAEGMLAGGNLTTLCHLMGTPLEPSFDGCILLLEDINEPLYRVDRMLTQFRLAGKLAGVKGVLLGEFTGLNDPEKLWELVLESVPPRVPVWGNMPAGHGADNHTWPLGATARMERRGLVLFSHEG